ncbi:MAG: BON domain-containing protein [Candidatus Sulfotelmatobacter sp.]
MTHFVTKFATKKGLLKTMGALLAVGLLSATLVAETTAAAARHDNQITNTVSQKLAAKSRFRDVKSTVEDGIVTLAGTVDLYQRKLDAARLARKTADVQGVRNLITVAGPSVADEQLEQKLARKLTYVRSGYDSTFDYFALSVKDGVVTVEGRDRTGLGRDEALADIYNQPGVKDVVENISMEPVSLFDDGLRLRAARAIYRDPVLSKYAIDPARPIRIIVDNGHVTLYGSVINSMDKEVAGIRANQLFGAFSVENKLVVENDSGQSGM